MDMISQLPDDLLLRLLSFVPRKDVAATSLLSKRWRFLWMLVPELEFDDTNHIGDYKYFSQFVYRSLLSNKSQVVEFLHLKLGSNCPFIDIELWINIAISRHLRELEIYIPSSKGESFPLPTSLYTLDTLVTLTLSSFILLKVPFSVWLPSLKILSLKCLDYVDSESLPSLLSGCPNLEQLFVERHDGDETFDVTVMVPSLQRLYMLGKTSGSCGRFVINVPSLKYLTIKDNVLYNFHQIQNMPELVEADLEIAHKVTLKFLNALTSVHRLSLCLSLSEIMHHPSSIIFNQLVHLELYTFTEGWWYLLTCMLEYSPKLRFLKLIDKYDSGLSGNEIPIDWKPPSSVPKCLLSSLEAFVWIGYKGRQGDKEMATYVLKNAACLNTINFSPVSFRSLVATFSLSRISFKVMKLMLFGNSH